MRSCLFVWNTFVNDARVYKEAAALAAAGLQTTVVCLQDAEDAALPLRERVAGFDVLRVTRFPAAYRLCKWLPKCLTGLLTLCSWGVGFVSMLSAGLRLNADLYHSNDPNTLPQGWLCAKVLRRRKLIYDSHEVQSSRAGLCWLHALAERLLLRQADLMLMTTEMRAEYVAERYGVAKPLVIRNLPRLLDPDPAMGDLRAKLDLPADEPILLYQGGVQANRGLEQLVAAVPAIARGTLVIMGDGRMKAAIARLVRERGLERRVRFAPRVPYVELHHYTAHAYLGFQVIQNTCFNHYSTISNKLLEYIMAGVPVVASDFPEMRRIVAGYGVGLLVDPAAPAAIAAAANRLLDDRALHARCRASCQLARLDLNWERESSLYSDACRNLLSVPGHEGVH